MNLFYITIKVKGFVRGIRQRKIKMRGLEHYVFYKPYRVFYFNFIKNSIYCKVKIYYLSINPCALETNSQVYFTFQRILWALNLNKFI